MTRIFKYDVSFGDEVTIEMPHGARILTVQMQGTIPRIWAIVDADDGVPVQRRRFRIFGTGHPAEGVDSMAYIGTFQMHGGALVFHLFERVT